MNALRRMKYTVAVLLIALIVSFLHYNLLRTDVVNVVGTDVKRTDKDKKNQSADRDVRFITSVTRDGDARVYRNEDTGIGWPPYFKFDSADLTAQAQSFASEGDKTWILVTYYGWRIQVLSLFPNAISLKQVEREYSHLPIFNTVVLVVLGVGAFLLVRVVRRIRTSMRLTRDSGDT